MSVWRQVVRGIRVLANRRAGTGQCDCHSGTSAQVRVGEPHRRFSCRFAVCRSSAGRESAVPELLDLQQQNDVFDRSLGVRETATLLGDPTTPELLDTDLVTGDAFKLLGVQPLLGRGNPHWNHAAALRLLGR